MATETHATPRNRRSFLRMIALCAGVAALVACGATAAKPSLTEEERAALEALGDEMAADLAAGNVNSLKGSGSRGRGTVKFFNVTKGFGFIRDDSGRDVFVHNSGLIDQIRENERVDYDIQVGKKGLQAVNVRRR